MEQLIKLIKFLNEVIISFAVSVEPIAKATNVVFDKVLPYIGLILLIIAPVIYLLRNIRQYAREIREDPSSDQGIGRIIVQEALFLFEELVVLILFWKFPDWLARKTGMAFWIPWLRWSEIIAAFFLYLGSAKSNEINERRGFYSAIGHIAVILVGWLLDHWVGILAFSIPFILGYYLVLFQIALVVIPTNAPGDRTEAWLERWKRFLVLVSYTWGLQLPMFVITHAWEKLTPRIDSKLTLDPPASGIILTKSHQVAGITAGTQFLRVDGPGVIFSGKRERPFQVVDLRNQVRSSEIDVVSHDGISYKATVLASFRIDPEPWDKATYVALRRKNPLLRKADALSYTMGSFPFSNLRVRATMSITSTQATNEEVVNYWDQWALNVVEEAARKVLSQRTLDQLWHDVNDLYGKNALDYISEAIRQLVETELRAAGILLVAARVVDFQFPINGKEKQVNITEKKIVSWKADWERKRQAILDRAETEANRSQQEARAYAESILLNSIAEGLEEAQKIHPVLPKYIIAMRFLSSLQDFINKQPQVEGQEELKTNLREWQARLISESKGERHP